MSSKSTNINVFLSSTASDLKVHRAVARNVILDMGWHPMMMEHQGASAKSTVDACCNQVDKCQLFVLVVAFRQGWVPTEPQGGNGNDSITAFELRHAQKREIPVLMFLADDNWPGTLWEDQQKAREWVKSFRRDLNQPAVFFGYEADEELPDFKAKLRTELAKYYEELAARQARELTVGFALDYFEDARKGLAEGNYIPFIGNGLYDGGPLSPKNLAMALAPELETEGISLATAAEYCERRLGSRRLFLDQYLKIIHQQSEAERPCPIYDLLAQMSHPRLILSATNDCELEKRLADAGQDFATVAHIIHSYDGQDDGKILVLHKRREPKICRADEVDLRGVERVVYKPLGSPLLHAELPEEQEFDTVVVTESDHLHFLGRLEHEGSQIPTRFSRDLQTLPLLFIGYALDLWHYRLVMQVFQSIGGRRRQASTVAVRQPPLSHMEEIAWQRLGADLIPMDPKDFAGRLLSSGPLVESPDSERLSGRSPM